MQKFSAVLFYRFIKCFIVVPKLEDNINFLTLTLKVC